MEELVPLIEQMAAETPDIAPGVLNGVLARAHAEGGRVEDARKLLEKFASVDFDLTLDQLWTTGMVAYADAAVECRDPKYAAPLFDRLAPWADQVSVAGGITAQGPISHYLAGLATVLGRYDEADAYFAQSAAFNDRVSAKFFAAQTNLSWGKMLAERNGPRDADKARDLLNEAHSIAAANGYGNVERRAAAALQLLDA
jgi:tetratricopeptide (TPR) repeat protein